MLARAVIVRLTSVKTYWARRLGAHGWAGTNELSEPTKAWMHPLPNDQDTLCPIIVRPEPRELAELRDSDDYPSGPLITSIVFWSKTSSHHLRVIDLKLRSALDHVLFSHHSLIDYTNFRSLFCCLRIRSNTNLGVEEFAKMCSWCLPWLSQLESLRVKPYKRRGSVLVCGDLYPTSLWLDIN